MFERFELFELFEPFERFDPGTKKKPGDGAIICIPYERSPRPGIGARETWSQGQAAA